MIRIGVVAAALVFLAVATGPGHASRLRDNASPPRPGNTVVRLSVPPASLSDTRVVYRGGSAWFAVLVSSAAAPATLRVYRWHEGHWRLDGVVRVDELPPIGDGDGGGVSVASLTRNGAPDFTLRTYGADTQWFGVVSRINGTWQMVPFDYGDGPTAAIDAAGVRDGLVHAEANGCGCAMGPETYSWYRFNGRIFVPASPPGRTAACSPAALGDAAAPREGSTVAWQLRQDRHRPLSITRYACRDGWALARGFIGGKDALAVYEQDGSHWLELAAGPVPALSRGVGVFVIARSLFSRLRSEVGLRRLKPARTRSPYAPYEHFSTKYASPEDLAPVTSYIPPGAAFTSTSAWRKGEHLWLATAVESQLDPARGRARLTVQISRWTSGHWVSVTHVPIAVREPHGDVRIYSISGASLTGSAVPDFQLGGSAIPSWAAVVSSVGGAWHVVPFRVGHHSSATAEVPEATFPNRGRVVVQRPHGTVDYRFRGGAFRPTSSGSPDPPCTRSSLAPRQRAVFTHLACGYGYALGTGVNRRGRSVAAVFEAPRARWSLYVSARTPARALQWSGVPRWLDAFLTRELRR